MAITWQPMTPPWKCRKGACGVPYSSMTVHGSHRTILWHHCQTSPWQRPFRVMKAHGSVMKARMKVRDSIMSTLCHIYGAAIQCHGSPALVS